MENHYLVTWQIDQWANSPEEAIAKAILAMPVPAKEDLIATVFDVVNKDTNEEMQIDTLELEDEAQQRFINVLDGIEPEDEFTNKYAYQKHHADCNCSECLENEGQDRKSYTDDQDRKSYTD